MIAPVNCRIGEQVTLKGYADDFDTHIVGVEFSLDEGETWALYDTSDSESGVAVAWSYAFRPSTAGDYRLLARSVTEDGCRSPEPAVVYMHVY